MDGITDAEEPLSVSYNKTIGLVTIGVKHHYLRFTTFAMDVTHRYLDYQGETTDTLRDGVKMSMALTGHDLDVGRKVGYVLARAAVIQAVMLRDRTLDITWLRQVDVIRVVRWLAELALTVKSGTWSDTLTPDQTAINKVTGVLTLPTEEEFTTGELNLTLVDTITVLTAMLLDGLPSQ